MWSRRVDPRSVCEASVLAVDGECQCVYLESTCCISTIVSGVSSQTDVEC